MKKTQKNRRPFLFTWFFLICPLLLASCVTTPDPSHLERDPEALGYRTGRADALAGRANDYSRHLHQLHPSADEDDFEDAYDDAYDEAEEELDERQSSREYSSRRAYDDGYDAGALDRDRGLSRNPRRHEASDSGSRAWMDGYVDGWNGR